MYGSRYHFKARHMEVVSAFRQRRLNSDSAACENKGLYANCMKEFKKKVNTTHCVNPVYSAASRMSKKDNVIPASV